MTPDINNFPKQFKKGVIKYELLITSPHLPYAIYSATMPCYPSGSKTPVDKIISYELHEVAWNPERVIGGKTLEAGWSTQPATAFGKKAWASHSLAGIQQILAREVAKDLAKIPQG